MKAINKLIALMILGTTFTGCSLFSNKGTTVTGDQATTSTVSATPGLDATQSEVLGRLTGDWSIVSVNNKTLVVDEDQPYLIFEPEKGQFYASNGCNIINGDYSLLANGNIQFSNVISSRMACPVQWYHDAISQVLNDGVTVKIKSYNQGNESYLDIISTSGSKLMTLRRHNMEMINGKWLVTQIGDLHVSNPEVNLFFDIPELKVHGNTGCNYFNGEILIDTQVPSSISFSQMAVTLSMCPDSETEMAMLVALEETHTYRLQGSSLYFLNSQGKVVMKLHRE
ncbi:MAG: META domain-containing protein [Bacteroidales bacterium]|nr:META domain-containing protein [Bacteroidales bacterium]